MVPTTIHIDSLQDYELISSLLLAGVLAGEMSFFPSHLPIRGVPISLRLIQERTLVAMQIRTSEGLFEYIPVTKLTLRTSNGSPLDICIQRCCRGVEYAQKEGISYEQYIVVSDDSFVSVRDNLRLVLDHIREMPNALTEESQSKYRDVQRRVIRLAKRHALFSEGGSEEEQLRSLLCCVHVVIEDRKRSQNACSHVPELVASASKIGDEAAFHRVLTCVEILIESQDFATKEKLLSMLESVSADKTSVAQEQSVEHHDTETAHAIDGSQSLELAEVLDHEELSEDASIVEQQSKPLEEEVVLEESHVSQGCKQIEETDREEFESAASNVPNDREAAQSVQEQNVEYSGDVVEVQSQEVVVQDLEQNSELESTSQEEQSAQRERALEAAMEKVPEQVKELNQELSSLYDESEASLRGVSDPTEEHEEQFPEEFYAEQSEDISIQDVSETAALPIEEAPYTEEPEKQFSRESHEEKGDDVSTRDTSATEQLISSWIEELQAQGLSAENHAAFAEKLIRLDNRDMSLKEVLDSLENRSDSHEYPRILGYWITHELIQMVLAEKLVPHVQDSEGRSFVHHLYTHAHVYGDALLPLIPMLLQTSNQAQLPSWINFGEILAALDSCSEKDKASFLVVLFSLCQEYAEDHVSEHYQALCAYCMKQLRSRIAEDLDLALTAYIHTLSDVGSLAENLSLHSLQLPVVADARLSLLTQDVALILSTEIEKGTYTAGQVRQVLEKLVHYVCSAKILKGVIQYGLQHDLVDTLGLTALILQKPFMENLSFTNEASGLIEYCYPRLKKGKRLKLELLLHRVTTGAAEEREHQEVLFQALDEKSLVLQKTRVLLQSLS